MNKTQAQSPKNLNENGLIVKAQSGDEQACRQLLLAYTAMVRARAAYYSPTGESDDFFQEGMFALYSAIQDYNFSSSLSTFARLCVDRRLIGVLRRRSLKKTVPEDKFVSFTDLISSPLDSPEEQLISKEEQKLFWERVQKELSAFEYGVLKAYLDCGSISKTAELLGKDLKAVNNALFRMRAKLKKLNMPK